MSKTRAHRFGVMSDYTGMDGTTVTAPAATVDRLLRMIDDGGDPPDADLRLNAPEGVACHLPQSGARWWGVAVQLYQLRSARNWGIGDFADLEQLAGLLATDGADFIGLNPLHATFLSAPDQCSPFRPSDRRLLNPLYIAVDRVDGYTPDMMDAAELRRLRDADLVDYAGVAAAKLSVLRKIWEAGYKGQDRPASTATARWAVFEAISAHFVAGGGGATWRDWPVEWHDPEGEAVRAFAAAHAADVAFHVWLQHLAEDQLARASAMCRKVGMAVGLYLDVAVGEDPGGAGCWGRADVLSGARIGAPPDQFSTEGQDWGLAPLSPVTMAAEHSAPMREVIASVARDAGALRIDHVMGLWQLFLIPEGGSAADGTYVRYPLGDTLRALADVSRSHGVIVVGEDLGNVPTGFREVMQQAGLLSYRILLFEREEGGFIPPEDYPRQALACVSTHDMPPFRSWWRGDDDRLRETLGLVPPEGRALREAEREEDRRRLLAALHDCGHEVDGTDPGALAVAVHAHLAAAPSQMFVARLEDLAGEDVPVNVPGTSGDVYPNWRPKLRRDFEEIVASPLSRAIIGAVQRQRPSVPEPR